VLKHKLSRAAKTASLHNFNASYYLALSAAHDVRAPQRVLSPGKVGSTSTSSRAPHSLFLFPC